MQICMYACPLVCRMEAHECVSVRVCVWVSVGSTNVFLYVLRGECAWVCAFVCLRVFLHIWLPVK